MTRRVAITGIGTISSLGLDRHAFWNSLREGLTGIECLNGYPPGAFKFSNGAEARGFDPLASLDPKEAGFLDRFAQMGLVAALEAVRDAGIEWTHELRDNTAIVTGSSLGGKYSEDEGYYQLYSEKRSRFNPMSIPKAMMNALTSRISLQFGITGPAWTVSTACSSSNHAIGQAFEQVRYGHAELAIAGGADAPFTQGVLRAWEALRVVSPTICRPFSRDRDGLVLGEGAAILVLEPLEAALARSAPVYCELAGFGMSSDAHHITQPSAEGASRAMRRALQNSNLDTANIGYINAHGTGTLANDSTETAAIHSVFGDHAQRLAVSSTKSMHGHALGAAGALEAAATALSLYYRVLPPTIGFTSPGDGCDLDYVPNHARHAEVEAALSNSFAFGGLNAVLAFRARAH